jgi:hypothetical protein
MTSTQIISQAFTSIEGGGIAAWWREWCDAEDWHPDPSWVVWCHDGHAELNNETYEEPHWMFCVPDPGSRPGRRDCLSMFFYQSGRLCVLVERTGKEVWLTGDLHRRAKALFEQARAVQAGG